MHGQRQGSEIDDSAVPNAAPRRGTDTVSGLAPASLELGPSRPDRGDLTNPDETVVEARQPLVAGQLTVAPLTERLPHCLTASSIRERSA